MNKEINKKEELFKKYRKARNLIEDELKLLRDDTNVKRYIKLTKELIKINENYERIMYKYIDDSCNNLLNINV